MFWEFGVTDNLDTLSFSLPIANTSIVYTFPQGEPHAVFMKKKKRVESVPTGLYGDVGCCCVGQEEEKTSGLKQANASEQA